MISRFDENKARNESAALVSGACNSNGSNNKQESNRNETKLVRILRLFFENVGWFDFQSIRRHGDSCLHSTVSTLRHSYGIEIDDEKHVVFGFNGAPTRCKKYRLRRTPENLRRVRAFLGCRTIKRAKR